jgi:hypothetical protein
MLQLQYEIFHQIPSWNPRAVERNRITIVYTGLPDVVNNMLYADYFNIGLRYRFSYVAKSKCLRTTVAKKITYSKKLLTNSTELSLFEKPPGTQLPKNYRAFCGTRRFITAFTKSLHRSFSWVSHPYYPKILWRIDPLLGNARNTHAANNTEAVFSVVRAGTFAMQRTLNAFSRALWRHTKIEEVTQVGVSCRSVPRLCFLCCVVRAETI